MTPRRFFIDTVCAETALIGEEFRHAKNVLRLSEGDEVVLLDGSGREYSAIVSRVERDRLLLHVTGETPSNREPEKEIVLLVGALKGDKTELVIQKATELGVSRIVVFTSRYSSAYVNENKLARFERVAREAAKQCLRARAPAVELLGFEEALKCGMGCEKKLFACEFLQKSDEGADFSDTKSCAIVVGSEGGFSEEEFALAKSMGYSGISLGKRILRAETAAIAVCTLVARAMGELG